MGTREVYEQKLRSGNLHHDPTMNPGLGTPRCPRCLSLLAHDSDKGEWTITPVLHDATAVAGSGIGGMLSAIHSFNTVLLGCRDPIPSEAVEGTKVVAFLSWAYSTASVFGCQCYIWRLFTSQVCSTHRGILLCYLKCLTLRDFTSYSIHRRGSHFPLSERRGQMISCRCTYQRICYNFVIDVIYMYL
ncbi:uncharacterized protein LOC126614192 isoform X2 [Malus sylvestris]|uniref:uncharacterized protein isoform X2 n=1 Tax=Malus domestica TaxID=3750 RepID=UPI0010A9F5C0|nr:uncharacterized protein LOC114824029 isoform X2 [Malus domestica]XP_050137731.1 uncharacterized protein LOC126614192 isoform X2 [Malus sylvestris]